MPTIHDVAKRAQVSTATVSRVLSSPEKVLEATRRRVLKAVSELGYSPNASAKSLRTLTTRKLLVTVPYIANPFFSQIIQGIEEAAQREGYAVVLGDVHHDPALEERYGEMLLRREVDGLIFLGHTVGKTLGSLIKKGSMPPIVNGCEYSRQLGVPSAHVDNEAAAYEAMNHIYGLGHSDVGVITGTLASPLSRDRLRGAQRSAREHGKARHLTVVTGDFSIDSGIAGAAQLLARESRPTAIFCFSDEMAIGVLDYVHRAGLSVPEALSVVGFDDIRIARHVRPALTTISQPMLDIGRETVRLLLGV
ncbi:MAG TPA: LacI family DNA-binding transcriptional regulator, partial [Steroidobacteraceae bacterium]